MKFSIFLFTLLVILLNNVKPSEQQGATQIAQFKWDDSCLTGCDIGQSKYWNDTNAITNASQYIFELDVSKQSNGVNLFVNSTFNPAGLSINGNSKTTLTITIDFTVNELVTFQEVSVLVVSDNQFTFGMINTIGQTLIQLTSSASLVSSDVAVKPPKTFSIESGPPVLTINENSTLSLQDQSSIRCSYMAVIGSVRMSDKSEIEAMDIIIQGDFSVSTDASLTSDTIEISYCILNLAGSFDVSTQLSVTDSGSLTATSLRVPTLYIDPTSSVTVVNGTTSIQALQLLGQLTIMNGKFTLAPPKQMALNTNALLTLSGSVVATIGNVIFSNNLQTKPDTSNCTIYIDDTVYFTSFLYLKGIIYVNEGANLYLTNSLDVEECIYNRGSVTLTGTLACYQQKLTNFGQFSLLGGSLVFAVDVENNGTINAIGNTKITGNVESSGTISISPDVSLQVTGYVDLFENSELLIHGIGYNTNYSAFDVINIITLDGELFYNISDPPKDQRGSYVYHLITSDLYFENNFTSIIADPSLESLGISLTYVADGNEVHDIQVIIGSGKIETSSDYQESQEQQEKEREKEKKLSITFGILIPIFIVGVLVIVFYIYSKRRGLKNRSLYEKIHDNDL